MSTVTVVAFVQMCVYFCIPFTQSVLQNEGCLPALLAGQHLRVLLYCVRLSGLLVSPVPRHEAGRSLSFGWRCSDLQLRWEAWPWRSPGRVLAGLFLAAREPQGWQRLFQRCGLQSLLQHAVPCSSPALGGGMVS